MIEFEVDLLVVDGAIGDIRSGVPRWPGYRSVRVDVLLLPTESTKLPVPFVVPEHPRWKRFLSGLGFRRFAPWSGLAYGICVRWPSGRERLLALNEPIWLYDGDEITPVLELVP